MAQNPDLPTKNGSDPCSSGSGVEIDLSASYTLLYRRLRQFDVLMQLPECTAEPRNPLKFAKAEIVYYDKHEPPLQLRRPKRVAIRKLCLKKRKPGTTPFAKDATVSSEPASPDDLESLSESIKVLAQKASHDLTRVVRQTLDAGKLLCGLACEFQGLVLHLDVLREWSSTKVHFAKLAVSCDSFRRRLEAAKSTLDAITAVLTENATLIQSVGAAYKFHTECDSMSNCADFDEDSEAGALELLRNGMTVFYSLRMGWPIIALHFCQLVWNTRALFTTLVGDAMTRQRSKESITLAQRWEAFKTRAKRASPK